MKAKRFFAGVMLWLTALCWLMGSGCSFVDLRTPWDKQTEIFHVQYDYGFHNDGKIAPLLSGCSIFFDLEKYEIEFLAAGDAVYVEYTGDMMVLESYPGQVVIQKGSLINVWVQRASVDTLVCGEVVGTGEEQTRTLFSETLTFDLENVPKYVMTQSDGSFKKLTEVQEGETLYASYTSQDGVNTLYGLYQFDPTAVKETK